MQRVILFLVFGCLITLGTVIVHYSTDDSLVKLTNIPTHFPRIQYPEKNKFTQARWELGKKLFYDPILSKDSTISCASCHKQRQAFSDDKTLSLGFKNQQSNRNAPSLANVAYHPYFMREGSVPTLEMQVLVPIQEKNEFAHNIVDISKQLQEIPEYLEMSQKAYGRIPDPFVITRALAVFERTLISGNSKYDQYKAGKFELSQIEQKGHDLFFSNELKCSFCHSGFNFTDYRFANTGLYENYLDVGRYRFTGDSTDLAKFKTPSLRNVEVSNPYMHDGSLKTLEEVLQHYNEGGKNHFNKSKEIKPLNLNEQEKNALIAFLKTLTDEKFLTDERFVLAKQ